MPGLISLLAAVAIILALYFGVFSGKSGKSLPPDSPLSGAPGESYMETVLKAPQRVRKVVAPAVLTQAIRAFEADKGHFPPDLKALEEYMGRPLPRLAPGDRYVYNPSTGDVSVESGPSAAPGPESPPAGGPAPGPITPQNVRDLIPRPPASE